MCLSLHLENKDIYKKHIGYYLVDDGIDELLKRFNINKNIDKRMSKATYLSTIFLGTILIDLVVLLLTYLIPLNFSIRQ